MKKLKLMLSLAILVFATTASFSQQTKKSEAIGKPDRVSRKQAHKGKPEAVKEMQAERGIGQGQPEKVREKKANKDEVKRDRKSRKKGGKKGRHAANGKMEKDHSTKKAEGQESYRKIRKQRPNSERTAPTTDGRYPTKEGDDTVQMEKKKEEPTTTKRRSRKGL